MQFAVLGDLDSSDVLEFKEYVKKNEFIVFTHSHVVKPLLYTDLRVPLKDKYDVPFLMSENPFVNEIFEDTMVLFIYSTPLSNLRRSLMFSRRDYIDYLPLPVRLTAFFTEVLDDIYTVRYVSHSFEYLSDLEPLLGVTTYRYLDLLSYLGACSPRVFGSPTSKHPISKYLDHLDFDSPESILLSLRNVDRDHDFQFFLNSGYFYDFEFVQIHDRYFELVDAYISMIDHFGPLEAFDFMKMNPSLKIGWLMASPF